MVIHEKCENDAKIGCGIKMAQPKTFFFLFLWKRNNFQPYFH